MVSDYIYFWGSVVGTIITIGIFIRFKQYRTQIIQMGILIAILSVVSEYWNLQDYWNPPLLLKLGQFGGLDDVLFGIAAGGIGSIAYNLLWRTKSKVQTKTRRWIYPLTITIGLAGFVVFHDILRINTIFAADLSFVIQAILMLAIRRDLIMKSIMSGLLAAAILVGMEIVASIFAPNFIPQHYLLYGQAPILFGVIVLTEILWGMCFGLMVGPVYEFAEGIIITKK